MSKNRLLVLICEPFQWIQMLCKELNTSFVLGVVTVYGFNQGFSGSLFRVVSDYYWKDVQKIQPSTVQLYVGFYYIPLIMKPVWGLLTDIFTVNGYHRRPYFVISGILGVASALSVALVNVQFMPAFMALICLIGVTASMAIADVTIDDCIAKNSIQMPSLASDMQSLCGFCTSVGALIGFSTSGMFVHQLGAKGALGLLAFAPALLIMLGFFIYELRSSRPSNQKLRTPTLGGAMNGMYKTIKYPQVWKPSLYMYLSLALSISTHEGQFYWYTDPKAGPAFSQEFVGMIYAIGAVASIAGVLIYHKLLKDYSTSSGSIPDYFFVIFEECVSRIVSRIRWMPMIVLSTKLCPLGIEGTFFALLMCIDSLGQLSSKWSGGLVLHLFHVTRSDFTNLWLVMLIKNSLRFATLALIFLVPKADQYEVLIPPDLLKGENLMNTEEEEEETIQLVAMNEKMEAMEGSSLRVR
ncbi:hypothetical protein MKX01_025927 [Papaver californicum]|nr:hypothetical protein MKX01_025927 [Papaver californicum]